MRFLIIFAVVLVFSTIPVVASAAPFVGSLVPECSFGGGQGPYCQACDLVKLVKNVIDFAIYASVLVATLMFVYAGFLNVTAVAGGQEQLKKSREIFTNVFIGLIIILAAWLVVDLVMKTFVSQEGENARYGPWNEIRCVPYGVVDRTGFGNPGVSTGGGDVVTEGVFAFASEGIARQKDHASPQLGAMLDCMATRTSFTITSISDSLIVNGSRTWDQCRAGECQHQGGGADRDSSWHYGGTTGNDLSYAVDIRTRDLSATERNSLMNAASRCGGRSLLESDHLHVTSRL